MMNQDQARFYLAAMIDGEGHVECLMGNRGWHRRIIIANTDMALIEATAECCDLLDIGYTISTRTRKDERHLPCLVLRISGIRNLRLVLDHVPLRSPKKLRKLQFAMSTVKKPHLRQRDRDRIVHLREEGLSAREIAGLMGCAERTIHQTLRRERDRS
jgi:hypothetical protein